MSSSIREVQLVVADRGASHDRNERFGGAHPPEAGFVGVRKGSRRWISRAALGLVASAAQVFGAVIFDFDTGSPSLTLGTGLPLSQSSGGLTATFSAGEGASFSIQNPASAGATLSLFSAHFVFPDSGPSILDVSFDRNLVGIGLTYATIDFPDNLETPSDIRLEAFQGLTSRGSVTTHAAYGADTYPMGTLSFNAPLGFDRVEITCPVNPDSLRLFAVDRLTASLAPVPEPSAVASWTGLGLLALIPFLRRNWQNPLRS